MEAKSRVVEVKAVSGFTSSKGNKEAGDRFDYDVGLDPDQLMALGLIKEVKAVKAAPNKAAAPKDARPKPSRQRPAAPGSSKSAVPVSEVLRAD